MDKGIVASVTSLVQVASIVIGVVISVLSFDATRQREALARQVEAAGPFLQLRQNRYNEALHAAAILANPGSHSSEELEAAKKRFRELYVAELSMVEAPEVEAKMVALANEIDPEVTNFTVAQAAAYQLAHALRDSFVVDWKINR